VIAASAVAAVQKKQAYTLYGYMMMLMLKLMMTIPEFLNVK